MFQSEFLKFRRCLNKNESHSISFFASYLKIDKKSKLATLRNYKPRIRSNIGNPKIISCETQFNFFCEFRENFCFCASSKCCVLPQDLKTNVRAYRHNL